MISQPSITLKLIVLRRGIANGCLCVTDLCSSPLLRASLPFFEYQSLSKAFYPSESGVICFLTVAVTIAQSDIDREADRALGCCQTAKQAPSGKTNYGSLPGWQPLSWRQASIWWWGPAIAGWWGTLARRWPSEWWRPPCTSTAPLKPMDLVASNECL